MTHRLLLLDRASTASGSPAPTGWISHPLGPVNLVTGPGTKVRMLGGELAIVGDALAPGGERVDDLGSGCRHLIVASDGQWFADHVWGRFVAIWIDRMARGVGLYRDPSGQLPLYFAANAPVLAFTDLDDALPWLPRLEVDAEAVAHRLVYGQLQIAKTAIAGVRELLPGEAVLLPGGDTRLLWSPWRHTPDPRSARIAPDSAALRETIMGSVGALTSGAGSSLLELSGGLDSSILAASLAQVGRAWSAATVTTPGPEGDERAWASAVADHVGAALATLCVDEVDADLRPPERLTPSPGGFGTIRAVDRAITSEVQRLGGPRLVSGTGGDNVFCSLRSPAPVVDALRIGGPAAAFRTVRDLAALTSTDIWTTLRQTLRYWRLDRTKPMRWRTNHDLLASNCRPPLRVHPWLIAPAGRLSGSRAQIVMLLGAHAVLAAHDRVREADMVFPLLAQPVLEACLAIASPYWITGGRDRSVARTAFASLLPDRTISRRSKGHVHGLIAGAYERNRISIGKRLAEGRLASLGIIDPQAVRRRAGRPAGSDDGYSRLLDLLDAELWIEAVASRMQ